MKIYIVTALFACLFTSLPAHAEVLYTNDGITLEMAEEITPIDETVVPANLKLVGKGVAERNTQDSIALACVGSPEEGDKTPGCSRLRYVFFRYQDHSATFFGRELKITNLYGKTTQEDLEKTLQAIKKDFKEYISEKHHIGTKRAVGVMSVGVAGVYVFSAATLLVAAPVGVGALICLFISDRPVMDGSSNLSTAFLNQDGWNWSSRPKTVSAKRFAELKEYIRLYVK